MKGCFPFNTCTQTLQGEHSIILALQKIPLGPVITWNYQKPKIPTHTVYYCSVWKVIPMNQRQKKKRERERDPSSFKDCPTAA